MEDKISIEELEERSIIQMEMLHEHSERLEKIENVMLSMKKLLDKSGIENLYEDDANDLKNKKI